MGPRWPMCIEPPPNDPLLGLRDQVAGHNHLSTAQLLLRKKPQIFVKQSPASKQVCLLQPKVWGESLNFINDRISIFSDCCDTVALGWVKTKKKVLVEKVKSCWWMELTTALNASQDARLLHLRSLMKIWGSVCWRPMRFGGRSYISQGGVIFH